MHMYRRYMYVHIGTIYSVSSTPGNLQFNTTYDLGTNFTPYYDFTGDASCTWVSVNQISMLHFSEVWKLVASSLYLISNWV